MLALQGFCLNLIKGYLDSKPPVSQTVLDRANKICLLNQFFISVVHTMVMTSMTVFTDSGDIMSKFWLSTTIAAFFSNLLEFIANVVTQAVIVSYPSLLDNTTFEKGINVVMYTIPGFCSGSVLALAFFEPKYLTDFLISR